MTRIGPSISGNAINIDAVLFDLDGTLIDSAPDLAGAANDMRIARGMPACAIEQLRPMVGAGARGMIGAAFGVSPQDADYDDLRDEFLQRYEARMTQETHIFPEVVALLNALDALQMPWGIVTNKITRFSDPLVRALGLLPRAAVLVCGDTTAHAKPHPAPLLEAARLMKLPASSCIYVGDDLRDVQAGRAAGMRTVAVRWGYLGLIDPIEDSIEKWDADHLIATPSELLKLLEMT